MLLADPRNFVGVSFQSCCASIGLIVMSKKEMVRGMEVRAEAQARTGIKGIVRNGLQMHIGGASKKTIVILTILS